MSEHIRRGACAATGKRCFDTRSDDKHNLRRTNLKLAVFKCQDCGFFHQGGWQGIKDRSAHRRDAPAETMTVGDAATVLNVSPAFVTRLVQTGHIRSVAGMPHRDDITRLTKITK